MEQYFKPGKKTTAQKAPHKNKVVAPRAPSPPKDAVAGGQPSRRLPVDHPDAKALHDFDLDSAYGPCLGISRAERWERAEHFGLNPPKHVRTLLEAHPGEPAYVHCLWEGEV